MSFQQRNPPSGPMARAIPSVVAQVIAYRNRPVILKKLKKTTETRFRPSDLNSLIQVIQFFGTYYTLQPARTSRPGVFSFVINGANLSTSQLLSLGRVWTWRESRQLSEEVERHLFLKSHGLLASLNTIPSPGRISKHIGLHASFLFFHTLNDRRNNFRKCRMKLWITRRHGSRRWRKIDEMIVTWLTAATGFFLNIHKIHSRRYELQDTC